MFEWLDATLAEAERFPDTAFIVRAHPDEARSSKPTREPVGGWLAGTAHAERRNVIFVGPENRTSSYELIDLAKFSIVYNSTVGIEAAIQGSYVLAGGWSRYRRARVGHHIDSREEYSRALRQLLQQEEKPRPDPEWPARARRLMYFCHHFASIDMTDLIAPLDYPSFGLTPFEPESLAPGGSPALAAIVRGVVEGGPFVSMQPRQP
jgi:hypothetical protein